MQEGAESTGKLVVSRGDAPELLESIEEAFDKMAFLIAMPVDLPLGFSVAARWNIGQHLGGLDLFDEFVAVVALIGRDCGGRDAGKQSSPLCHVSHLATSQDQTQRIAQGIDTGVNLGGQSATRPTDRLIATVFLRAPAEC